MRAASRRVPRMSLLVKKLCTRYRCQYELQDKKLRQRPRMLQMRDRYIATEKSLTRVGHQHQHPPTPARPLHSRVAFKHRQGRAYCAAQTPQPRPSQFSALSSICTHHTHCTALSCPISWCTLPPFQRQREHHCASTLTSFSSSVAQDSTPDERQTDMLTSASCLCQCKCQGV